MNRPEPFGKFLEGVHRAQPGPHIKLAASRVRHEDDFAGLRRHVLDMYGGVEVVHSTRDFGGAIFDFVPIEQQPSLRGIGWDGQEAPDLPPPPGSDEPIRPLKSARGNIIGPSGTIPMRRLTLDMLARFGNVQRLFQKSPHGGSLPIAPDFGKGVHDEAFYYGDGTHNYAHASQAVSNLGGHSTFNVWAPQVDLSTDSLGNQAQSFSLSQHWYVAGTPGTRSGSTALQTFEVGIQTYPALYNSQQPALFIGYTADSYTNFTYNLFGPGFVQTSNAWAIAGVLIPQSTLSSTQYELDVSVQWAPGPGNDPTTAKWWLYIGTPGVAPAAVGYYPISVYNGGPLSTGATLIDYGGEVDGNWSWPPMGSGSFSTNGYKSAAYHKNIYYYTSGGISNPATLVPDSPTPGMYTTTMVSASAPWNRSFFFGGPGGVGSFALDPPSAGPDVLPAGTITVTGALTNWRPNVGAPPYQIQVDNAGWDLAAYNVVEFHDSTGDPYGFETSSRLKFCLPPQSPGTHTVQIRHKYFRDVGASVQFTVPTPANTITVAAIPLRTVLPAGLNAGTPFQVSGTLKGYPSAPTLQYQDTWGCLVINPGAAVTWDTTDSSNVLFQAGPLATTNSAYAWAQGRVGGARATAAAPLGQKSVQEVYFYHTAPIQAAGATWGFATKAFTLGTAGAGAVLVGADGAVYVNGTQVRVPDSDPNGIVTSSGTLILCIDRLAARFWWKTRPRFDIWNENPSADPATNSGGIDISSLGSAALYPVVNMSAATTGTFWINPGSSFLYPPPAGFLSISGGSANGWHPLPSGSTVTPTTFTFTHPGPALGNLWVTVRDANQTAVSGSSSKVSVL